MMGFDATLVNYDYFLSTKLPRQFASIKFLAGQNTDFGFIFETALKFLLITEVLIYRLNFSFILHLKKVNLY